MNTIKKILSSKSTWTGLAALVAPILYFCHVIDAKSVMMATGIVVTVGGILTQDMDMSNNPKG